MPETKSTGTLIYKWTSNGKTYRLISVGKFTRGFEDEYRVETQTLDGLGDPCWIAYATIEPDERQLPTILISALKEALREVRGGGLRMD